MAVITISRQFGAGGKTLGKMIAQKLDYTLIDEDIIQQIAEKANVSTDWVESIEKEAGGKLQKFMSTIIARSYVERILGGNKGYMDEEIYVNTLHKVITKIATEDNVVIIGRGGQYILQDHPNAFHILLIAQKEDRIKFMETHYNLSSTEANRIVKEYDKRRINLYRKFGKEDYDQPGLYHVTLNMSKVDIEKASDFIYKMVADVLSSTLAK